MARTCGENLPPAVLRGHVDPLNFILPRGELTGLTAHLYQDPPIARVTNLLAQRAVLEIVQRLPNEDFGEFSSSETAPRGMTSCTNLTIIQYLTKTRVQHIETARIYVHSSHASVARSSWRFL